MGRRAPQPPATLSPTAHHGRPLTQLAALPNRLFASIGYNIWDTVELFFNLAWLALTLALVGLWLRDRRTPSKGRARLLWQLTALAILAAVLLPAVSLTDDLQACTTPAESEHLGRRASLQPFLDATANPLHPHPHTLSLALLAISVFELSPSPQAQAWLPHSAAASPPRRGLRAATFIRPPPAIA